MSDEARNPPVRDLSPEDVARGLVESRSVPRAIGMERLRQVAGEAPFALDTLCDRVLAACTDGLRRDDDICLVAMRP